MYKFPFSTFASVFYSVSLEWSSEKCIIIRHPPTPMTLISELHFFFTLCLMVYPRLSQHFKIFQPQLPQCLDYKRVLLCVTCSVGCDRLKYQLFFKGLVHFKNVPICWAVVAHDFNPSTCEAELGRSL